MSDITVQLEEVLAEMPDIGQAWFDAAQLRALTKKQQARIEEQAARIEELEEQLKTQEEPATDD